jgi:hypothetical protein
MAQVSVGQVENLDEATAGVVRASESLALSCQQLAARITEKREEAEEEEQKSSQLLESALEMEGQAARALDAARARLTEANRELAAANSALGACQSKGPEENGDPPDCSSEESDVAAAETQVAAADQALNQATEALEQAKAQRMRMGQRLDLARRAASIIQGQEASYHSASSARLHSVNELADRAHLRIGNARAALDEYLAQTPGAASFAGWLRWSPQTKAVVTPAHLNERLNISSETLGHFVQYLSERDPGFGSKMSGYHEKLVACNGPVERHAVQLQMRKNLAGEVAEQLVIRAMSPLAKEVVTQQRTDLLDGSFTKTDFILKDLKVPIVLGRGEGRSAGVGESVAGEVKCGRAAYIYREKDHMVTQAFGHKEAAASLTICSRDVKDLLPHEEEDLRAALREAGSPLVGMLPRKEEVDKACWQAVTALSTKSEQNADSRKYPSV